MLLGFLDTKVLLVIAHLFGVAIGAGGAFASDGMFFLSVSDKKFSDAELKFIRFGSRMVWIGLLILFLTGLGLFFLDPAKYLASTKFLAKVVIVAVIAINGLVFHLFHIPEFHRSKDAHLASSESFVRKSPFVMASGAISMVSWSWAIILGALKSVPYPYWMIVTTYAITALFAALIALLIRKRLLGMHR